MLFSELQKLVDKSLNEAGDGEVYLITGINTEVQYSRCYGYYYHI